MEQIIIDARVLPPQVKHPTIIEQVNQLVGGQDMILINDHDPKPLYYQLQHLFGNVFSWDYEVSGIDDVWKVRITKKVQLQKTIGELAALYPAATAVFQKYKIDFCCNGKRYLNDVCQEKGLDYKQVLREVKEAKPSREQPLRFEDWTASAICDFIINNHHNYIRKKSPQVIELLEKVYKVHGDAHPQLGGLNESFNQLIIELYDHMEKEEDQYFPAVKKYESDGIYPEKTKLEEILHDEHQEAGDMLVRIRELCNDYNAPHDGCASFELLYNMLHEFEEDLHQHIHLENNILFPRMEKPVKFTSCPVK
ncbi:MAG: iron-sulfur cluster repair di-iron protein [Candidatus Cyclobacteriaceae bacterium M2_1C_046]